MPGIALPQHGVAPVIAGDPPAAGRRAAGTFELIVWRAVAHGVVDGHLVARLDGVHGVDGDLAVETGIRLARVIDVVRRLVRPERGEIKPLLDLRGVMADVFRKVVQLIC